MKKVEISYICPLNKQNLQSYEKNFYLLVCILLRA